MIYSDIKTGGSPEIVDMKRLVHELQTHKIELEMQNDELRRTEFRLRQSTKRYADLYDHAPVGYLTLTRHAVIRDINLKGATMLQKDRVQLIGRLFDFYIHDGYKEIFQQHIAELRKANLKQSCKIRLMDASAGPVYAHLESLPWVDDESGDFQIRTILSDISAQVRIETELMGAKDKAEQANRAKSQFLANMSHEVRTPLSVIMGYSDLVLMELDETSPLALPISGIKRNSTHLLQVIDDILDISRVEAGELFIAVAACDPMQEIRDTLESLKLKAEDKGLTLSLEVGDNIPSSILTDAMRLRQILMNLVNNAIKFTTTQGVKVEVKKGETDDSGQVSTLIVDVIDTGCGISEHFQSALFKPFSQLDSSHSRKVGGIGLGLYLSRRLAQALGGDIRLLESQVDVGSTFRLTLNMRVIQQEVGPAVPLPPRLKVTHDDLAGMTILLVEDSLDNQFVVRSMIEMAGGKAICAEDGVRAISMALEGHVDLVLMDLQLPLLDGYKAASELRRQHFDKPILALTAHAFHEEREKVLRCKDFDGFLTKPIGFKPLVEIVKKWTDGKFSHKPPHAREMH